MKTSFVCMALFMCLCATSSAQFESDIIQTSAGDLELFFIGHGTLMFKFQDQVIHIDPVSREADYTKLPDADLILVTHQHGDHLDMSAIEQIMKENTEVVMTEVCLEQVEDFEARVMKNGDAMELKGIPIRAIPAYNLVHKRSNGNPYHPKGEGNGYILDFADTPVLVGGDTENIPEYAQWQGKVKVAFLPMNLPYTMSPAMAADAARTLQPEVLYPYHYGNTDTRELLDLLKDEKSIEVRIRELQ